MAVARVSTRAPLVFACRTLLRAEGAIKAQPDDPRNRPCPLLRELAQARRELERIIDEMDQEATDAE